MNLLLNSFQQTGKKSENGKTGSRTNPATVPPQKFLLLLRYNLFIGVDEMRIKNITVTVSIRVSVMVRVSLVLFFSTNSFGASSVAICRRCVYKILFAFAQHCVYNTLYTQRCAVCNTFIIYTMLNN